MTTINKVGPDLSWRLVYNPATKEIISVLHTTGYTESINVITEYENREALLTDVASLSLVLQTSPNKDPLGAYLIK